MRARALACALLFAVTVPASAQDARLKERLDARTADSIAAIVAGATARGLPAEPLVQKALEGAAKGAPGRAIADAVRSLADRLGAALAQLGVEATEAELVAGASALYAGVTPEALARLRAARGGGSLAMPLVALTFFVRRGVEREASVRLVESLVRANVAQDELLRLQQMIDLDVRSGAAPEAASATRVEALLRRYGGAK